MGKNVYKGCLASGQPRSSGEIKFEKWCEKEETVEWFYRNGDKGDEYFSIVYQDNAGKQKLFYPDYIVKIGGKVWIIEIKGNFNMSAGSENNDDFTGKKAEALKAYCEKHAVCGGIVRYSEDEAELLIATDGYSENKGDPCWKLLESAI